MTEETIGKRIASLRQEHGWTQQSMAGRLALSRVAVSHIEMDLSIPSERTITLLAGLFKISPYELVNGTTYPLAKAERLPEVACTYTPLEMETLLLENDLAWLKRLEGAPRHAQIASELWDHWIERREEWDLDTLGQQDKAKLSRAWQALALICRKK